MRLQVAGFGIVALAVLSAPVAAQEHQHHGDKDPAAHASGEMMGMMLRAFSPAQLLERKADLKLTAEQVTKLEQLQTSAMAKHDQAVKSHDTHRQQMMEALHAADVNPQVVRGHFTGAHDAMGQAHWAQVEAGLAAMALLTADQRAAVRSTMGGKGMQHREGQSCCQGEGNGMSHGKH